MEVSQESGFNPITIVLETEEEAICLWAALNISGTIVKKHSGHLSFLQKIPNQVFENMWNILNDIYSPRKES